MNKLEKARKRFLERCNHNLFRRKEYGNILMKDFDDLIELAQEKAYINGYKAARNKWSEAKYLFDENALITAKKHFKDWYNKQNAPSPNC